MKFKKPIEVQAGISDGDPTNPLGISGYLLSSDGSNVNWVSPGGLSAETAEAIVQPIKANEALVKGDPVYIVGFNNGQNTNIVAKADSSDVAKMPVVGLVDDDYANQAFGTMTAFGSFNGDFDTTGGTESWAVGDIIFVKPGGGLTNIKPGGTDLIQNVAIVSRVNSQTGELEVIALGRTNDVPNLPTGRLFVGTAANTSLASDVIYVDDTNDRVGIGTTTPSTDLEVSSTGVNGVDISQSASNASQSGRLFFTTNTASEGFALFNSNGTFQVNSGGIPNNTSGTNRISIIGSTGNVGIGTTSPSFILDVANGINDNDVFRINGANADVLFSGNVTAPTGGVGLWNFINTGTNATTRFYVQDANNSNDRLTFRFTGNNGSNEVLAGTSFGNVGIGTTSPTRKLHVLGPGNSTPNLAGGILLQTSGGGGLDIYATSTAANPVFNFRTFSGEEISFSPNSTELMRLKGSSVGIGTTSPNSRLEVNGEIDANGGDGYRIEGRPWANWGSDLLTLGDWDGEGYATRIMGSNSSEVMRVTGNNVGIGTTSPQAKLQVNGGVQLANDTAGASASKVGTFRYRTSGNNSYVDMCMQTGASTFAWVNIVTNSW